jgi:hypothetical protein
MGVNRQYPFEPGNARKFAKAAVGESYPLVRIRHFQHQLQDATTRYASDQPFADTAAITEETGAVSC